MEESTEVTTNESISSDDQPLHKLQKQLQKLQKYQQVHKKQQEYKQPQHRYSHNNYNEYSQQYQNQNILLPTESQFDNRRKSSAFLRYSISSVSSIENDEDNNLLSDGIIDITVNSSSFQTNLFNVTNLKQNIMSNKKMTYSYNDENFKLESDDYNDKFIPYSDRIQPFINEMTSISIPTTISSEESEEEIDEYYQNLYGNNQKLKSQFNVFRIQQPTYIQAAPKNSKTEIENSMSISTLECSNNDNNDDDNSNNNIRNQDEDKDKDRSEKYYIKNKIHLKHDNHRQFTKSNQPNKINPDANVSGNNTSFEPISLSIDTNNFSLSLLSLDLAIKNSSINPTILPSQNNKHISRRLSSNIYNNNYNNDNSYSNSSDNISKRSKDKDKISKLLTERERSNFLPLNFQNHNENQTPISNSNFAQDKLETKAKPCSFNVETSNKQSFLSIPVLPEISISPVSSISLMSQLEDIAKNPYFFNFDQPLDYALTSPTTSSVFNYTTSHQKNKIQGDLLSLKTEKETTKEIIRKEKDKEKEKNSNLKLEINKNFNNSKLETETAYENESETETENKNKYKYKNESEYEYEYEYEPEVESESKFESEYENESENKSKNEIKSKSDNESSTSYIIPNLPDIPLPHSTNTNIDTNDRISLSGYNISEVVPTRPSSISSISLTLPSLKEFSSLNLYSLLDDETKLKHSVYPTHLEKSPKMANNFNSTIHKSQSMNSIFVSFPTIKNRKSSFSSYQKYENSSSTNSRYKNF
jgi:hypothetical protein